MDDLRKGCPMRHENGNCTVIVGFCTAVNDPICEGLHNAYDNGYRDAAIRARQERENTKQMANADRIRAMSDDDLSQMLTVGKGTFACFECREIGDGECSMKCDERCLEWLQQPAEEETA